MRQRTWLGFTVCVVIWVVFIVACCAATGQAHGRAFGPRCAPTHTSINHLVRYSPSRKWSECSFRWNGQEVRVLAARISLGARLVPFGEPGHSAGPHQTLRSTLAVAGTNGDFVRATIHSTDHLWVRNERRLTTGDQGGFEFMEPKSGGAFIGFRDSVNMKRDAFGGEPLIVRQGVNIGQATCPVGGPCHKSCGRYHCDPPIYDPNPRTAVGVNATGTVAFLVTVDGRQDKWSTGIRFPAEGYLMLHLGSYQALNLDGGGSTDMWMRHRSGQCQAYEDAAVHVRVGCIVNRPVYTERSVVQAIGLVP